MPLSSLTPWALFIFAFGWLNSVQCLFQRWGRDDLRFWVLALSLSGWQLFGLIPSAFISKCSASKLCFGLASHRILIRSTRNVVQIVQSKCGNYVVGWCRSEWKEYSLEDISYQQLTRSRQKEKKIREGESNSEKVSRIGFISEPIFQVHSSEH